MTTKLAAYQAAMEEIRKRFGRLGQALGGKAVASFSDDRLLVSGEQGVTITLDVEKTRTLRLFLNEWLGPEETEPCAKQHNWKPEDYEGGCIYCHIDEMQAELIRCGTEGHKGTKTVPLGAGFTIRIRDCSCAALVSEEAVEKWLSDVLLASDFEIPVRDFAAHIREKMK